MPVKIFRLSSLDTANCTLLTASRNRLQGRDTRYSSATSRISGKSSAAMHAMDVLLPRLRIAARMRSSTFTSTSPAGCLRIISANSLAGSSAHPSSSIRALTWALMLISPSVQVSTSPSSTVSISTPS